MPRRATNDRQCWNTKESCRAPLEPEEFSRARPRSAPGYSELMRGKAACHPVSPILWRSTLPRSGWRHGMAMTVILPAFGLSMSFYRFVVPPGFDPMSYARDLAGDPS